MLASRISLGSSLETWLKRGILNEMREMLALIFIFKKALSVCLPMLACYTPYLSALSLTSDNTSENPDVMEV